MNKTLFLSIALLLSGFLGFAQEDAGKLAKQAARDLVNFNLDQKANAGKLTEAVEAIDKAYKTDAANKEVLETRADVYSALSQQQTIAMSLGQTVDFKGNPALEAFEMFNKSMAFAEKKWQKKKVIDGISGVQGAINTFGAKYYESKNYAEAFKAFKGQIDAHKVLKENGATSVLDEKAAYDNQVYITALSAMLNSDNESAMPYLLDLYKGGNAQAAVYQGLYTAYTAKGNTAEAEKILTEGRAKHPDDTALLFEEINLYLKAGKLDQLTGRLQSAIEKEPNNVSLYGTLANVYDNLYTMKKEEGKTTEADEYFALAKNTYTKAIEINPKSGDAYYGLGTMYYNKAALKTQEIQALSSDYSAAATKKIAAIEKEMTDYFNQAFPYFKKAEQLNPNDQNTLIALKEITARLNDFDATKALKERLEKVQAGGKNADSYYKN